ncbi:MAG: GDSL-type esterase/lipase family protein [Myxococcota bacterium]
MLLIRFIFYLSCAAALCAPLISCRASKDSAPIEPASPVPEAHATEPSPLSTTLEADQPGARAPTGLALFVERLRKLEAGDPSAQDLQVLHIGDSHVASDLIGQELRRLFQERFGDGGRGYIFAGRPWRRYRQAGVEYAMQGDWERHNARGDTPGPFGAGGVRLTSSMEGAAVTRQVPEGAEPFDRVDVTVLTQPRGGQLRIVVDGVLQGVVPTADEATQLQVHRLEAPGRMLRLEVLGDGPVTLLGTRTAKKRSGVIVSSVGLNGAQFETFLRVDQERAVEDLRHMGPDLVIVTLGTNEAYNLRKEALGDIPPETEGDIRRFAESFLGRIQRAAPDAACVVMLPMDFAYRPSRRACRDARKENPEFLCDWHTTPSLGLVTRAVRDAADARGCSPWDAREAMGGEGAVLRWAAREPALAARDSVHLTRLGYAWIAERLYADLVSLLELPRVEDTTRVSTTLVAVPETFGVEE